MTEELNRVPVEAGTNRLERETLHLVHERVNGLGFWSEFTPIADWHRSSDYGAGVGY